VPTRGSVSLGPSPLAIKRLHDRPGERWRAPAQLPSLRGVKRLSFDLETRDEQLSELGPGVRRDPKTNYIVGWAIGTDDGRRFYFPVRHEGGGNLDPKLISRWARAELNAFDGELVGAHLLYDLDWAANEGVTFENVRAFHDIQNAEPLIDEWRFSYAMEQLSRYYLGIGKEQTLLEQAAEAYGFSKNEASIKTNLWRLPAEFVGPYAEGDVDRPLRIFEKQEIELKTQGLERVYEVERKLIPLLLAMRRRGVKINVGRAEEVTDKLKNRIKEMSARLVHLAGKSATFTANETLAKALKERGLPVPETPTSGKIDPKTGRKRPIKLSVKKAFLEKYQSRDELCALIMEGRKLTTLVNTFMTGHILGHHVNGRIHCNFNQLKSEEGGTIARFSSSDPNLQNVPARDKDLAPIIRSIFEPETDEDWERLDESQIEYRLLVNFARGPGAEEARELYRTDPTTDFHIMAGDMIGADAADDFVRKRVKNTNFCKVYGGGDAKLAETFGCSIPEAKSFSDKYDQELPFVSYTYDEAMKWANRRGFIETLLGRRQRFPLYEPSFGNYGDERKPPLPYEAALAKYGPRIKRAWTYMALNRKLQASAADVMKKAMVDGWEAGVFSPTVLGAPLLTIHDELDNSKPRNRIGEEAMVTLKRIMEIGFKDVLRVPIVCDRETGPNWGYAKKVKKK